MKSKHIIAAVGLIAMSIVFVERAEAGMNSWTTTGPEGGSSWVVHYSKLQAGAAFASNGNTIYRTTDNGVTWNPVVTGLRSAYPRITSNPQNPMRVLYATDTQLFTSNDAGLTFTEAGDFPPLNLEGADRLLYSDDGAVIYALVAGKLVRSTDDGATWSLTSGTLPTNPSVTEINIAPSDNDLLYVSAGGTVWKSVDGGASWSAPNPSFVGGIPFAIDPTNSNHIFAGSTTSGLMRSMDGGVTWATAFFQFPSYVRFDPLVPTRVLAFDYFGGRVYRNTNSGTSGNWTQIAKLKTVDTFSISFDGNQAGRMMAGTSEGVFLSEDAGLTWQKRIAGFKGGDFSHLVTHSTTNAIYAGGDPGPFGVFKRGAAGTWDGLGIDSMLQIGLPFGIELQGIAALAIAPTNSDLMYAARGRALLMSSNGGTLWTKPTTFFDNDQVLAIAIDPANSQRLYVFGYNHGLFLSTDGGVTWTARTGSLSPTLFVKSLVIDPRNSEKLFIGGISGLFRSTDGGLNWTACDLGTPSAAAFDIAIDPSNSSTVYVASTFGLFRSDDGGESWTKTFNSAPLSSPQGPLYATAVAIDPTMPNVVVAAGNSIPLGAFRSLDRGATWETMQYTPPPPPIFSRLYFPAIAIDPQKPTNILMSVATLGLREFEVSSDLELSTASSLIADNTAQTVTLQVKSKNGFGATDLKLMANIPSDASNPAVQTDKGTCSLSGTHIECSLNALLASETLNVTLTLAPSSTTQLIASVSAREADPMMSDNSLSLTPITLQPPTPTPTPAPSPAPAPAPSTSDGGGGGSIEIEFVVGLLMLTCKRRRRARRTST